MIDKLKKAIPDQHPLRLFYHQFMAMIAAFWYGFPSRRLQVIGVTGTKGKTTTVNLIAGVLTEAGYRVGLASTTNFQVANRKWINESNMTTLSPFFLQRLLKEMVGAGCQCAVLEVSSHSIVQHRVWGINFDTAVLTNIGEDHLDYHGGFKEYLRAKGLLFAKINQSARKPQIKKNIVLNQDDENFSYFDQFIADRRYTYGFKGGNCYVTDVEYHSKGVKFHLKVPNGHAVVDMKLPGAFNVYNALAAACVGLANGINVKTIKAALESASTISGRFEPVEVGQKFTVIVDYAHTVESLKSLLDLYKHQAKGRLITVFGATGGGRDQGKRPKMGEVGDKLSDILVLTDDDPYEENSIKIIEDIAKGVKREEGKNFWKIPDRYEAIRYAISIAENDDIVVIAGKGGQVVQCIGKEKIEFDDRNLVREILSKPITVEL